MNQYLLEQIRLHPSMTAQDYIKFCYQAAFGAEHLLNDKSKAEKMLYDEYEATPAVDMQLAENISDEYCRVNLAAWKRQGLDPERLLDIFVESAGKGGGSDEKFLELIREAELAAPIDIKDYVGEYLKGGIRPVHHSREYRECEKPAYRVVRRDLL